MNGNRIGRAQQGMKTPGNVGEANAISAEYLTQVLVQVDPDPIRRVLNKWILNVQM